MSDILNNLIKSGIQTQEFEEFDYSPYNCFNNTVKIEDDKYRIKRLDNKIPMVFSLKGIKNQIL